MSFHIPLKFVLNQPWRQPSPIPRVAIVSPPGVFPLSYVTRVKAHSVITSRDPDETAEPFRPSMHISPRGNCLKLVDP